MKIFCSGIGGIGLSAYASLQKEAGHEVSGSDRSDSMLLQNLREQGITIYLKQDGSAVPADADLFVYSEAIPADAPERKKATEYGLRQISYFAGLGEISAGKQVVAVCGTHGKSSTTAMAAKVISDAELDPTIVVGTKVPDLRGRNWRSGHSDLFLLEACEYRRSFHYLSPHIVLMTNVDGDHFDAYESIEAYQKAFAEFLDRLPAEGVIITHGQDDDCRRLAEKSGRRFIDADSQPLLNLKSPGKHMQQNAQLVLALAELLGIDQVAAAGSLEAFQGTWRRSETKGEWQGVPVIDDYAHHPAELRATIAAFRDKYPEHRLVCVFQPHTHDRTLKMYDEFVRAFSDANVVIIPNVYDARSDIETDTVDVPQFVADIAKKSGCDARDGESMQATEELLRGGFLREGDVLLCLGAGDITGLAERMATNA